MVIFFILLCTLLVGCSGRQEAAPSQYASAEMWYQSGDTIDQNKIDLFYIVSTEVLSSVDSLGNVSYQAFLTPEDRKAIDGEFAFVQRNYCKGDFNLFAPYYHQFNFEALGLPEDHFAEVYSEIAKEVCEAFDYYMQHENQGRRFALVGFSQGAMLIRDLLCHMTSSQYQQMVAAYMLGYRLSAEDLENEQIIAANDETTAGVTVSFNSVMNTEAAWDVVCKDAVTAINPVNWQTDTIPAKLDFLGDTLTVTLDEASHLLIVDVPDAEPYCEWMRNNPAYQMANVSVDCLHRWDLLFYAEKIRENINIRNK